VRIWEAAGARRPLAAATTPRLVRLLTRLASDGTLVYHIAGACVLRLRMRVCGGRHFLYTPLCAADGYSPAARS
jgi:hypothetical protein